MEGAASNNLRLYLQESETRWIRVTRHRITVTLNDTGAISQTTILTSGKTALIKLVGVEVVWYSQAGVVYKGSQRPDFFQWELKPSNSIKTISLFWVQSYSRFGLTMITYKKSAKQPSSDRIWSTLQLFTRDCGKIRLIQLNHFSGV